MPQSTVSQDLQSRGKGYYGDPCYDSTLGSTKSKCKDQTPTGNLAKAVLANYGIGISDSWAVGSKASKHQACCPLDILNQDPIQCIKMALMASLLDGEYWEVYADEEGKASFIRVLPDESADVANLPRVQYCVPSLQPSDIANLVIVRSADPPPFRKCGKVNGQEWYDVLDGASQGGIRSVSSAGSLFPGGSDPSSSASDARGIMFTWGEVTGMASQGIDPTCEIGAFDQFGTIIYPDYERKQIYNDGVVDLYELQGFEQILFWLVDVDYSVTDDELAHYNIQFVKSSDVPVKLGGMSIGDTWNGHTEDFGVVCDVSDTGEGTGSTPSVSIYPDNESKEQAMDNSCSSVQASIMAANERRDLIAAWAEYAIPSFFGYGFARSMVSFNDYSKWNIIGSDVCTEDPIDNMYESTTSLWGNGCPLQGWSWGNFLGTTYVNVGRQKSRRTIDLPNGTVWVESGDDSGKVIYSFRAEAPSKASVKFGNDPWLNPFSNHMLTMVASSQPGNASSVFGGTFSYPGYLFGWDDGLYTMEELWAKVKIARPGIAVQGFGRGVTSFMPKISMKIKPVYQVDFPAAVAAKGETYDGCVDVYKDLATANQAYCLPLSDEPTEAEKLQEAMTGNTIDITIPFLFPDFAGVGQSTPSQVTDKRAFDDLCADCLFVANFLWNYIEKFKDEPHKAYTYVCGPPRSQNEVPKLGQVVETEYGRRTINSIAYNYSDGSSFTLNVEVGPVSISTATAGAYAKKRTRNEDVKGKIVDQGMGALYKVDVPGVGVIQAWNIDKYPWDVGDRVTVTLYNHPAEL